DRIIMMKTSPMNISVHTTNPNLRMKMLNNRFAGNGLDVMKRFIDAGIKINCQIVLCKGLNDGRELNSTMETLAGLYPGVESVAVVPAGLTKYREGLYPIEPYTDSECKKIIRQVDKFADKCKEDFGTRLFYCADELYIKADVNLPKYEDYEDFNQLENGVGLIAEFKAEFDKELKNIKKYANAPYRQVSIATGEAAYDFISYLVEQILESCDNLSCTVYKIKNEFFGENITVTGLVTGQDIARQLHLQPLGEKLFIPSVMLRYERDMFLDSMTVKELSRVLDIEVGVVECNGEEFIRALFA
ncbi:MAG: DUF512 domain-containing protein, partial [Oscillospiraceae bacterium]|nr:DUF512 domain-containing protein [Oscillospiraceae bacterium]